MSWIARTSSVLVIVTTCVLAVPAGPAVATPRAADPVVGDAAWILMAQLPDGAIATQVDRRTVVPYLANYAAMGLAVATTRSGDPRYVAAAWHWLEWYRDHQDAEGFVHDHDIVDGRLVDTGEMDSTDAYAGTFLLAVGEAWLASGDLDRLRSLAPAIDGAVRAIEATQDDDGLTWATPSWRAKYLMDQAETYAGLRATDALATVLGRPDLTSRAAAAAHRIERGVASLWNEQAGGYDWAVHGDGRRSPVDWSQLYPDALQQLWAVAFGLTDAPRARRLVAAFDAAQPGWAEPTAPATIEGRSRAAGYWPVAAIAHQRAADDGGAAAAATTMNAAAERTGRGWPYSTAEAGQLILLAQLLAPRPAPDPVPSPIDGHPFTRVGRVLSETVRCGASLSSPVPQSCRSVAGLLSTLPPAS